MNRFLLLKRRKEPIISIMIKKVRSVAFPLSWANSMESSVPALGETQSENALEADKAIQIKGIQREPDIRGLVLISCRWATTKNIRHKAIATEANGPPF
jgi:hypothetical protein